MNIDFHNHFYPPSYLAALEKGDLKSRVGRDADGNPLLYYAGDHNVLVPPHRDLTARLDALEASPVDMQVLTLTTPGVHVEEAKAGVRLAQLVNDDFADIQRKYPRQFAPLATLPMQDAAASVVELERAVTQLGLRGAMLFTNINGTPLDAPAFWPIYEKAAELDVPLMLHPTSPTGGAEPFADYRLVALVGFVVDTTLAAARLVFAGVLEKWPTLKFVLSHLGGTVPYIAERVDRGYYAYPEVRGRISKPPSEYFKQMYYDTVSFNPSALKFALDFAGPDKLVLGSDFPHQIGDLPGSVKVIESLDVPARTKKRILETNAARLLKLNSR